MTYDEQRVAIIADLKGKMHREDWHGVADAANDLRELEAEQRGRAKTPAPCLHGPGFWCGPSCTVRIDGV